VSQYQKGKTNMDFTEARDSERQWHQLGHMQVCISLQTDNHDSTPPLSFLQAGCPSCRPTNSVKALKLKPFLILNQYCQITKGKHLPQANRYFIQFRSIQHSTFAHKDIAYLPAIKYLHWVPQHPVAD